MAKMSFQTYTSDMWWVFNEYLLTEEHVGTACGKEITIYMGVDRKDRYNYCPNCGAKMEVSEDA